MKWKLIENLKENHYSYYRVQNDGTPLTLMCYSSVAGFHTWGISLPQILRFSLHNISDQDVSDTFFWHKYHLTIFINNGSKYQPHTTHFWGFLLVMYQPVTDWPVLITNDVCALFIISFDWIASYSDQCCVFSNCWYFINWYPSIHIETNVCPLFCYLNCNLQTWFHA